MQDVWAALSDRVVMVARYAAEDGIGRFADQLIDAAGEGHRFVRVGTRDGPGDYHRDLDRGPRALWLLRDARRGDDIVLHYHPHYYVRGRAASRIASLLSWAVVGRLRRITLFPHESDPEEVSGLERAAQRLAWRQPRRVVVHSDWERQRHLQRYGAARRQQVVVVDHGDFFSTTVDADRAEARRTLGLPAERTILLMIGFISPILPDKGYDRAVAAVREAGVPDLELHMVGSPIRDDEDVRALLDRLRAAADGTSAIRLHEGFVDDHAFDLWIRAADAVLTPYREAVSSSVIARAHLLGTPVVTSDVGGLAAQARPGDIVVRDDADLVAAIRAVAGRR